MRGEYVKLRWGDRVRFQCLREGRCCSTGPNVGLTAFDVLRIARFLGTDWRKLRGRYIAAVIADMTAIPVLMDTGNGRCVFLKFGEDTPYCSIYPARPLRCLLYPFIPLSPGRRDMVYVDGCCPGVGRGEEIEPPWGELERYCAEAKYHYSRMHKLVFNEGYEPLQALELLIVEVEGLIRSADCKRALEKERVGNKEILTRNPDP